MMRIYTVKQRVRCLSTPKRFSPWISSSKTVYQISLRVVIPKERTNTCWSALFSCGCMTRLSPCRSWCWQWQLQWSWLGCRTRLSVRNHPEFCDPKTMAKGMDPKWSKTIGHFLAFIQKLMEKYGSWLIFLVFTVFYIRELLETIMVTLRPTATDASIAFFISAKWLVAPRAEGVKGLLLLEQERWPVEVFSFYPHTDEE